MLGALRARTQRALVQGAPRRRIRAWRACAETHQVSASEEGCGHRGRRARAHEDRDGVQRVVPGVHPGLRHSPPLRRGPGSIFCGPLLLLVEPGESLGSPGDSPGASGVGENLAEFFASSGARREEPRQSDASSDVNLRRYFVSIFPVCWFPLLRSARLQAEPVPPRESRSFLPLWASGVRGVRGGGPG